MATSHIYEPPLFEGSGVRASFCSECWFVHLDPLPDAGNLADYYRKKFWQDEKVGAFELICNEEPWRRKVYSLYARILGAIPPGLRRRRIFDLGSGHGLFAAVMADVGWDTWAVEPSREASQHAFGWRRNKGAGTLIVAHDTIEGFRMGEAEADAVSLLWLLEHVPDPAALLERIRVLLRPEGTLLLIVPNEPLKGGPPFLHPTHCNYWDWSSLRALLDRCGFRAELVLGTAPMHSFLPTVDYLKHAELGGRLHELIRETESGLTEEGLFRRMRWYAGNGCRDLVVFARRAR